MNKQEYIEKHNQLSQQMKELEESYINANAPYPVGTRVKVTGSNGKSRIGIVKGSIISSFNEDVVPILKQETNDHYDFPQEYRPDERGRTTSWTLHPTP